LEQLLSEIFSDGEKYFPSGVTEFLFLTARILFLLQERTSGSRNGVPQSLSLILRKSCGKKKRKLVTISGEHFFGIRNHFCGRWQFKSIVPFHKNKFKKIGKKHTNFFSRPSIIKIINKRSRNREGGQSKKKAINA